MLDAWFQDARFAIRLLRKSPLFTLTAALSLAIGIGANSTIFSVASAMLLRPMPGLADAAALVDIGRTRGEGQFDTVSFPNYQDIRARATSFSGIYAHQIEPTPMGLGSHDGAERVYGALVSDNFFTVLGTRAHLGRLLHPGDDGSPGANAVAVLGYDLWARRFGADPSVAGRQITINGHPFSIVGVAEQGFQGPTLIKADMWVPLSMLTQAMPGRPVSLFTSRGANWLFMGGRLKDGVTIEQANGELAAVGAALAHEHPRTNERTRFRAAPIAVVPGMTRMIAGFLGLLMAIVVALLLVACVNLAGMLLARGAARTREIAVRLAIGARPSRIARQMLTEIGVLFVIGAAAGLMISDALKGMLLALLPELPVPLALDISTDWRVLGFTAAVSLLAALLCGLAPALQARRTELVPSLKTDTFAGHASRLRLRSVFVIAQVTLSLVLAITAGLFMRALGHAANAPTGFNAQHVDVVSLDLALARHSEESGRAFIRELLQRARALPGVQAASSAADLPLDGGRMSFGWLKIPGAAGSDSEGRFAADWNVVEPGFFRTLELRLVRGRDFDERDTAASQAVAIVNEAFARAAWPNAEPVGQLMHSDTGTPITVVGVAADAQLMSIGEVASPYIYVPLSQRYQSNANLVVKTSGPSAIPDVRTLIRSMNANLPVTEALPLSDVTALGTIPQRVAGAVAGTLGIVGLLLAAIGIYGVTSYAVTRRTREIGIRMALGADHAAVMRLLLKQGVMLTVAGLVLGTVLAAASSRLLSGLLFGIDTADPIAFGTASLVFAVVALLATYVPARRALGVDPIVALRHE